MTAPGDHAKVPLRAGFSTDEGPEPCHESSGPSRAPHRVVRPSWANLRTVASGASPRTRNALLFAAVLSLCLAGAASAGAAAAATTEAMSVEPVELLTDAELQSLVSPVALYPDDLLAIVLPASTFPLQVVLAARFLEAREADPNLEPDEQWDASIVALLNYPEVVALLDGELDWTWQLGEAVLLQQEDVIAAVADFRRQASAAGNLESDDKQVVSVSEAGAIEITPVEREVIHVPYYDPVEVVTYQPRRVYHYYPRAYPVYYYPYPSGHYFSSGPFWGVTSAFSIGWYSRSLHWHHHGFHDHPYFGHSYYDPFYYRRPHIWLSFYRQDRLRRHDRRHHDDNRWRNDDRHRGSRPGRRPDRRGIGHRPDGAGGRDRAAPPPTPVTGRGIERFAVAIPDKRSSHIPVKRTAQQGASPGRRAERGPAPTAGTRRLASSSRQQASNVRSGETRRRPAWNSASGQPPRTSGQASRVSGEPARIAGQPPRISTPVRKPASVQRPAVTPRLPAQSRPPRTTRPAAVRKPARSAPPRAQPPQRVQASSPGARAASAARRAPPAVPRTAITSSIRRSAARAAQSSAQSPRPRSSASAAPPPPVKPAPRVEQRQARQQAREPDRRRPKSFR